MKRFCRFFGFFLIFVGLASCGKSALTDEHGCFRDYEDARAQAQKDNKNVLVLITMEGDDDLSQAFVEEILEKGSLAKNISKNYALFHADFSQSSYVATVVKPGDTEQDQEIANENAELLQKNTVFASGLNVQSTPAVYILSKDLYFLAQVDFDETLTNYSNFSSALDSIQDEASLMASHIEKVKAAAGLDKVSAIDDLYEATDSVYRPLLSNLIKQVPELDKKNESGLLSKYLLAGADVTASKAYMTGDSFSASIAYARVAENPDLTPAHRQQAYYLASYLLAMSGSTDYDTILSYMKKAIEADPDAKDIDSIKEVYNNLEYSFKGEK